MNPEEYARLSLVEREHWFYRGKREAVRYWLRQWSPLGPDNLLVDCGAGTGLFAEEMLSECRVLAIDDHAESLAIAAQRLPADSLREGSGTALPVEDASADVVTALDVIEHIEDPILALKEMRRILRPDGLLVVTVPALMALWSDWDEVLHHFRRYSKELLEEQLREAGFEILECRYVNCAVLPLVWAVRTWRKLRPQPKKGLAREEDRIPSPWLNELLFQTYLFEATGEIRFPLGVGLLACARPV